MSFVFLDVLTIFRNLPFRSNGREINISSILRYSIFSIFIIPFQTLAEPCFPPHYDIVNKYVEMYHNAICQRVGLLYFKVILLQCIKY